MIKQKPNQIFDTWHIRIMIILLLKELDSMGKQTCQLQNFIVYYPNTEIKISYVRLIKNIFHASFNYLTSLFFLLCSVQLFMNFFILGKAITTDVKAPIFLISTFAPEVHWKVALLICTYSTRYVLLIGLYAHLHTIQLASFAFFGKNCRGLQFFWTSCM